MADIGAGNTSTVGPAKVRTVKNRRKDYWQKSRDGSEFRGTITKLYPKVVQAFQNKDEQTKNTERYWKIYNCELGENQQYRGDSEVFVPTCTDGIEGLVRRGSNMLFPESGHYTECIAEDGKRPEAKMALLDHYVERTDLRSLIKTLLRNGYVEGQFSVYVDWDKMRYTHTKKIPFKQEAEIPVDEETGETAKIEVEGEDDETDVMDVEETLSLPGVSIISAGDLAVWPESADSVDDAIQQGGGVAIALRVTEGWVKAQRRAKTLNKSGCDELLDALESGSQPTGSGDSKSNPDKRQAESAGIKTEGVMRYALVYQVWTQVEFPDSEDGPELAVIHYAGPNNVLGCRRCPFWIEKAPVLSVPDMKVKGSFFGKSRIDRVEQLQYAINDAMNIGMDSEKFALMPVFAADPTKNPQYASMVLTMGAVWKIAPEDLKVINFPQLHQMALEVCMQLEARVNQSLGLTNSIIPQQGQKAKRSQAQVAEEQAAAVANINDEIIRIEQGILNPLLERFAEYDQQFRDDKLTVQIYGELGVALKMEDIEPNQFNDRYIFRWRGTQAFQSAQKLQQKMAGLNVLRGIPPQMLPGRKIDIGPVIEEFVTETYGARVGRLVLQDLESQYSIPPEIENEMLKHYLPVNVRPTDDDQEHIEAHMKLWQEDPSQADNIHIKVHIQMHQAQMQAKAQAKMQEMAQEKGIQGAPGAGGQPGMAGRGPRQGAVPGNGRMQGPPGMIHQDSMPGAMPRKM